MKFYCEFASDKYQRHGTMLPVDTALASHQGYSSVYWFYPEDAKAIRETGKSRDFKQYPVFSNRLVLDIDRDHNFCEAVEALNQLREQFKDYEYEVFFSGKKGYHMIIATNDMSGTNVPHSHRHWIETNNIPVDLSIFQHGRLFRNDGALHEKTGRRKFKLYSNKGKKLHIPLVIPPVKVDPAQFTDDYGDKELFADTLLKAMMVIERPPKEGMRHTTFWGVATDLANAGANYDLALELCLYLNNTLPESKDDKDVEIAVEQAYRQAGVGS